MSDQVLPTIDLERCTRCGLCVEYCPTGAVVMLNAQPVITRPQNCAYCAICEETCPVGAVALVYEIVLPPPSRSGKKRTEQ